MRDKTPRRLQRWRAISTEPASLPAALGFNRLQLPVSVALGAGTDEKPGPDGIRHGLVARVRAEIAAGTYDTEEKWLSAEEALLRRVEARM